MKIRSDFIWAGFLIITAALFFYLGSSTEALENEAVLGSSIEEKKERIKILESKVQQLSEELTSRGIFSYPQANVIFDQGDPETKILIMLNGRHPIPNLEIERKVVTDYSRDADVELMKLIQKGKTAQIGTLSAHNPVSFDVQKFQQEVALDLIFKSEKNIWHQYIRSSKTADGDLKTFWVITNKDSEVIDKHIDEGYPTDGDGKVTVGANSEKNYSEIRMNSIFTPYSED